MLGEQRLDAVEHAGHAQVQAQVQAFRALRADLVEIPASPRAQREAAAEFILAQPALDDQDAVAREQLRVFEIRFGEERSEEHTSALQSLMRISYAVFCLKKKKTPIT